MSAMIIGAMPFFTAGLMVLVNPRGTEIFSYVRNLLGDSSIQKLIVEWQPPTPNGFANLAFFGSILVLLLVFFFSSYRPTPTEAFLILGFLWPLQVSAILFGMDL